MKSSLRSALFQQACDVVFLDSLLWLASFLTGGSFGSLGLLPWLLCSLASVLLNHLLVGRGLTLALLAGVNIALFAAQAALLFGVFSSLNGVMPLLLAFCFLVYTAGNGLYLAMTPLTPKRALVAMERTVLACAVLLFAQLRFPFPPFFLGALLLSAALCLTDLLLLRMDGSLRQSHVSPWGGVLVILGGLLLIAMVMALAGLVLMPLGRGILAAAGQAEGVFLWLLTALAWLKGLLDGVGGLFSITSLETSGETLSSAAPSGAPPSRWHFSFGTAGSPWLTAAFLLLAAALLMGLLVALFRYARGRRVAPPPSAGASSSPVVRSAAAPLPGLLARCWHRVRFEAQYCFLLVFRRSTPQGVLAYLRLRRRPRKGETLRVYLLRLSAAAPEDSRWLFLRLADEVDSLYYGSADPGLLSPRELSILRLAARRPPSRSQKVKRPKPFLA